MKTKLTLALVALITSSAFAAIPAVLPEFKNEKQLAEWRDEMAAKHEAATTANEDHAFYTGKPYIESTASYAFKYRSYNPDLARWTSEDPSGFPDGANDSIYAPTPTSGIDFAGLWKLQIDGSTVNDDSRGGVISIGGWDHRMRAGVILSTDDITSSSTNTSGTVAAHFNGLITKMDYTNERSIESDVNFSISVDGNGQISISATGGGFDNVAGNLQIGGSWSKDIGDHTATLTFASASMYGGTGISGIGLQGNGAIVGGGASVSWTNPAGKVSSFTTLRFKAVE